MAITETPEGMLSKSGRLTTTYSFNYLLCAIANEIDCRRLTAVVPVLIEEKVFF